MLHSRYACLLALGLAAVTCSCHKSLRAPEVSTSEETARSSGEFTIDLGEIGHEIFKPCAIIRNVSNYKTTIRNPQLLPKNTELGAGEELLVELYLSIHGYNGPIIKTVSFECDPPAVIKVKLFPSRTEAEKCLKAKPHA